MKKIICFLIGIFIFGTVYADMDLDMSVASGGGDIDADFWFDTGGGNFDLNINGYNFEQQMAAKGGKEESDRDMCNIKTNIANMFLEKNGRTGIYEIPEWTELRRCEQNLRFSVEQYTMNSIVNFYETRIRRLEAQVEELQSLHKQDYLNSLCDDGYWDNGVCMNYTYIIPDLELD